MMYASGREVPIDLATAHKWFNIAATKGHGEAARLRREIAAEMADAEIGQAQRAARDWLRAHPELLPAPHFARRPDPFADDGRPGHATRLPLRRFVCAAPTVSV
jgi:hypothetical protein